MAPKTVTHHGQKLAVQLDPDHPDAQGCAPEGALAGGVPMLQLSGVSASYGKIQAIRDVSLCVGKGEIVTIIGANGAGKTTTLMTVCGIVPANAGVVSYRGERIAGPGGAGAVGADTLPPRGLCQVPEGRRIFPRLTVRENLEMGAYFRKDKDGVAKDLDHVYDLFPILKKRERQQGGTLSGGEQQMLAMGRALMGRPKLLLLDEPSMGLAPLVVQLIFDVVKTINAEDEVTVLLVEQNANLALKTADRGYVMETGAIVLEDKAEALLENPEIRKAYLGE